MKRYIVLVLLLLLLIALSGCSSQTQTAELNEIETTSTISEATPEPTVETAPEPTYEAPAYESIIEGFNPALIEAVKPYSTNVSISLQKYDGKSKYKLQFNLIENSLEDCRQSIESALDITFSKLDNEDGYEAEYEKTAIIMFINEYGQG